MYLGNQPALSYTSFAKQDFTTSATTSYTLDYPVANENELALFINFVRQEAGIAYTASGTSLTLTSATSASDDMYAIFLGKAIQTVNPPSGSVGASQIADGSIALGKLSATGTKDSTTFLRGDNTFASAGGTNTPNFHAYLNGDQTLPSDAATKITFNAESWDTASAFDTSTNYRFTVPSGQAGKYFVYSTIYFESYTLQIQNTKLIFYVNGSSTGRIAGRNSYNTVNLSQSVIHGSRVLNLSVGDYIEVYAEFGASSTRTIAGDGTTGDTSYFGGYKLIE